jgi:hypothetical protein
MATVDGAMTPSTTPTTSFVNITSLVNIRLDMLSTAYRRWRRLFLVVLGRFCLTHHIDGSPALPLDPIWLQDDLTVLMWLHATLADDLLDMVMDDDITAHGVWKKIGDFFLSNKASRVVHLEQELHNLAQGELSAAAYRHRLKTLSDALADCDQPVQDRALVHQMIRGLNPKYHVLRQMLPAMPTFLTFMEARDQLIVAEQTLNMSTTSMTDSTALLSTNGTDFTNNGSSTSARQDNDRGQQSTGRGNGGRGRGNYRGRNRGRGTGRGNNNGGRGQAPQVPVWFQQMPPWGLPGSLLDRNGVLHGLAPPVLLSKALGRLLRPSTRDIYRLRRSLLRQPHPRSSLLHQPLPRSTHQDFCRHFRLLRFHNRIHLVTGIWTLAPVPT